MKVKRRIFLVAFFLINQYLFAESSLFLSPSNITANPKERISLTLSAGSITDAIAIQLDVAFNPSIIEIDSVNRKGLFPWLIWMKREGGIRIISGINPDSLPISGSGTVADISLITKALGTTSVLLNNPWVIKEESEEIPKTSSSTVTIKLGEPYLQFEPIGNQKTYTPFHITIYAIDPYGEPMSLTSTIALDDYTHTTEGSLTFNGTQTTGTVTIKSIPNRGTNRITVIADGISGMSNLFLIFASDSCHHNIDIPINSGTITCDIDPTTIGKDYYIDITEDITGTVTLPEGNVGLGLSIDVYTEEGEIEGSLPSSFKVSVGYREEDLGNIDESTLRLYTLIDNRWQITKDSGVDTQNNICYGWISHLSCFSIAGSKTTTPLLFWPNPYYPDIHKKLSFLEGIKEVKFYNIRGEVVEQNNLSSGVYIIILIDSKGRKHSKKLGVVK